jgi:hypothetical protein
MSGIIGDNVGRGSGVTVAPSGGLEAGTKTDFFQASAPTDWTQDTANNDKQLRVVSGTGGGTGGTAAVSSPAHNLSGSSNHNLAAASHTLAESELPSHSHPLSGYNPGTGYQPGKNNWYPHVASSNSFRSTGGAGSGGGHVHTMSGNITTAVSGGSITAPLYMDVIIAERDA